VLGIQAAWQPRAFAALEQMAGEVLDKQCVQALLEHRADVEAVQRQFQESRAL